MEEALAYTPNYAEVLKRRLPLAFGIGLTLTVISLGLALGLPPAYRSRAVILIEQQEIPQDLVRSLVTSFASQRIQQISQRVLTNTNLSGIIEKYALYTDERETDSLEVVLEDMREDISVTPISADVVDPKNGKAVAATIAFELAYENERPELAQRVANEVVSLFLNENIKQRTETSTDTLTFLTTEAEKLRSEVGDLEKKLADFKEGNVEQLPELTNLNIELMNRTENEVTQTDSQIRSLEQQRVYLESELAQQQPTTKLFNETGERILGPADRLKVLESEVIPLAARYGPSHPDVVTKRKEIESLRAQTGATAAGKELALRLEATQTELSEVQRKYGPDHPDIKRLTREISSFRTELANTGGVAPIVVPSTAVPDNPAYIQLQARLEATNSDLAAYQTQRSRLREKLVNLEKRLTNAPQVEREYRMLSRDYETAQAKYKEVLAKKQEAELASNLESKQQGERFTLIEPPVIPEEPDKPNRLAIGLLGTLLAISGGVGSGALAESLDTRLYGREGVSRLLGAPPLAVIPKLETAASRRADMRRKLLAITFTVMLIALAALMIHLLFRPLDVLFYQILREIGA